MNRPKIASLASDPTVHTYVCTGCGIAHRSVWELDGGSHDPLCGVWVWQKTAPAGNPCLCMLVLCSCSGVLVMATASERFRFV